MSPSVPDVLEGQNYSRGPRNVNGQILQLRDLAKSFSGVHAVAGATFEVDEGTITGLIGPNGAGKSTTINLISGILRPDAGRLIYQGVDLAGWPAHKIARRGLVRTFQLSSEFAHMTVLENLLAAVPNMKGTSFAGALRGKRYWRANEQIEVERARELLERFHLAHMEDAWAGELSGGQKRLVEIMRGLMARPQVLLLDEPFAGVNPALGLQVEAVLKTIRDEGVTMVLVEHEMGAVERLCDTIIVMALGKVLTRGSMAELRAHPEVLEAYLGG